MGIVEFLEARIAEDETRTDAIHSLATERYGGVPIYRNVSGSPARMLHEVAAKRAILKAHCRIALHAGGGAKYYETRQVCRSCEPLRGVDDCWPCPTVLHIAAIFSDHPDFNEEWRP